MSATDNIQQRKARKQALRAKQENRAAARQQRHAHQVLPLGIPGLPPMAPNSPIADHCMTKSIKRISTAARCPADWSSNDMNELIYMYNTACNLIARYPAYKAGGREARGDQLEAIIQKIRARRDATGHYGITGDEWIQLRELVTEFQSWLETIPTQRLLLAERHIDRVYGAVMTGTTCQT